VSEITFELVGRLALDEKVAAEQSNKAASGDITLKALLRKWAVKLRKDSGDIVGGALKDQLKNGIQLTIVVLVVVLAYLFAPDLIRKGRQRWSQLKSDTLQTRADSAPTRADTAARSDTAARAPR